MKASRIGLQFWCQYKEIQSIRALRIRVWRVYGRAGLRWGESLVTIWLAKRGEQEGLEKKNPVHPEARALSALITSLFIGIWTKWLTVMIENGFLRDIKWHVPVPFGIWLFRSLKLSSRSLSCSFVARTHDKRLRIPNGHQFYWEFYAVSRINWLPVSTYTAGKVKFDKNCNCTSSRTGADILKELSSLK